MERQRDGLSWEEDKGVGFKVQGFGFSLLPYTQTPILILSPFLPLSLS